MLKYEDLDKDQTNLVQRIYEHDETIVYATMGSGKTVCYLTAAEEMLHEKIINRVLIVAPLRPCKDVWSVEHKKWAHLQHLDIALAVGNAKQRLDAINSSAQIVVINIENLVWFLDTFKRSHNFDALCIDELSKFSNNGNNSVKKLRTYTKDFKHHVGLTGTPVHESFTSLFSQTLVMDGGKRLGKNYKNFLHQYFYPTDYNEYNWEILPAGDTRLLGKLKDLIYAMPDYTHTLPDLNEHLYKFEIGSECADLFKRFAKDSVMYVDDIEVIAENAAVLSGKLEQIASGFLYIEQDAYQLDIEYARVNAFANLRREIGQKKCLIFYTFEEEKQQIIDALQGDYSTIKDTNVVNRWNKGEINNLVLHPKSAGHGLNLADGGHTIILYSPIWSNDMFKQLVGRLWRRGQTEAVDVYTLFETSLGMDLTRCTRVETKSEYDAQFRAWLEDIKKGA